MCATEGYERTWPLAFSCVYLDSRDFGIVYYTVFKQNVLESLEVTKVLL